MRSWRSLLDRERRVTVASVPDTPVAHNDTGSSVNDAAVDVAVLTNDTDVEHDIDPASVSITTPPTHGAATVTAAGVVHYVPAVGFLARRTTR